MAIISLVTEKIIIGIITTGLANKGKNTNIIPHMQQTKNAIANVTKYEFLFSASCDFDLAK